MDDVLRAELPADLADELIGEDFDEIFASRGLVVDAGTVVTVVSAGLAVGANVATILVSREALGQFARAIRGWVLHKAAGRPHGEVMIEISAMRAGEKMRLRLEVSSENGTPQIDTAALTAFITSLIPDQTSRRPPDPPVRWPTHDPPPTANSPVRAHWFMGAFAPRTPSLCW